MKRTQSVNKLTISCRHNSHFYPTKWHSTNHWSLPSTSPSLAPNIIAANHTLASMRWLATSFRWRRSTLHVALSCWYSNRTEFQGLSIGKG